MFEEVIEWARSLLSPFLEMPSSTIFILFTSLVLNLTMMFAYRLMVDIDQLRENDMKIREYMRDLNDARKRGDKRAIKRLRRKEPKINKLRTLNAKQRSKVSFLFMIPFMVVYLILNSVFSGIDVVKLPFALPFIGPGGLSFAWWFIICQFAMHTVLSHLFGLTYEVE